jgi:hypothetical protein
LAKYDDINNSDPKRKRNRKMAMNRKHWFNPFRKVGSGMHKKGSHPFVGPLEPTSLKEIVSPDFLPLVFHKT